MKNVCLFDTAIGSMNMGDEIIFESAKRGLEPVIGHSSVYRLGTHVACFSPLQMLRGGGKIRFFRDETDLKFICGTSLIVPTFRNIQKQFMLTGYLRSIYKDSVLVGAGKSSSYECLKSDAARMYKYILSDKYIHSVRDDAAKEIIEGLGLKAVNTGCPTLWGMTAEACENIPKEKAPAVIFSVSGQQKYHAPAEDKHMIDCLLRNYDKVYAWVQTTMDEPYLRTLIDPEREGITVVRSLDFYAKLLDKKDIDYVGTRLHGGIFALQHGRRSLIVAIDHRAIGIYESNNIPIIRRSDIYELDNIINSDIITDIRTDRKAIDMFLGQFKDEPGHTD